MKNDENDDDEIYCVMDLLEKPWLIKDSRKYRKMTYNNCSLSNPIDEDDRMRFQYEVNPTFVNQKTDLSEEDLKRLEDQIITFNDSDEDIETTTVVLEDVTLNPASKNILDGFFNMQDFIAQPQTTTTTPSPSLSNFNMATLDEMFGIRRDDTVTQHKNFESELAPKKDNETLKHLEIELKRAFSELFQSDPEFQMNIVALINRRDDDAQQNYNQIIEILGRKLKEKLESFQNEQQINNFDENENDQQVTVNPNESISRKRRSNRNYFVVKDLNCVDSHEIDVLTCADCLLEVLKESFKYLFVFLIS